MELNLAEAKAIAQADHDAGKDIGAKSNVQGFVLRI